MTTKEYVAKRKERAERAKRVKYVNTFVNDLRERMLKASYFETETSRGFTTTYAWDGGEPIRMPTRGVTITIKVDGGA